jgi:hypothetical protein
MNTTQPLQGNWRFELDGDDRGMTDGWFVRTLTDTIDLPGTTDERRKGEPNDACETRRLTRTHPYVGPAFYQRDVHIPDDWAGRHIVFHIERTKHSTVWVDDQRVGSGDSLTTPHRYDVSGLLTPGEHRLTVRVDNANLPPVGDSHQVTEHTQTNWNGLLGRIELQVADPLHLVDVQAHTDVDRRRVELKLSYSAACRGEACLSAAAENTDRPHGVEPITKSFETDDAGCATVTLALGDAMQLWDEFTPALYRITINWQAASASHQGAGQRECVIGMRTFTAAGGQFLVNGRPTLLRGKHDACVFPLTGYAPMDVAEWERVLRIARSYGINHYRFHSWCPPRAAFEAADRVGMYMQPELPLWEWLGECEADAAGDVEVRVRDADADVNATRNRYLVDEGLRILREFGNHPSFCMFALGNELGGEKSVMASLVERYRREDPRRLYAQGSNNFIFGPELAPGDDYWTTMMTGGHYRRGDFKPDAKGREVRGSFCDHRHGHVNNRRPGTTVDYTDAIRDVPVPVIGHEVGQYQVFPRFEEIDRYTGVLAARNLETFQAELDAAGMGDRADEFFRASGALSVICYREDIEAALRTPNFGGFQLLDLQDFPGQGTALVGVLDAFMASKGLIEPAAWRQFCCEVVPLARMPSYVWPADQAFTAELCVANYGPVAWHDAQLEWQLIDSEGSRIAAGCAVAELAHGVVPCGAVEVGLRDVATPQKLTLELSLTGTRYRNAYPVWVYPASVDTGRERGDVTVADRLSDDVLAELDAGGSVLLLPAGDDVPGSVPGAFQSDFWCYPMFKKYDPPGTLGIVCDPAHPALAHFPTESHSNWQWWSLLKHGCAMILDDLPADLRPIVQVIDNFERNHRLGVAFECNVGRGRLLVCTCNLLAQQQHPEARQLLVSLLRYMRSEAFAPTHDIGAPRLRSILG